MLPEEVLAELPHDFSLAIRTQPNNHMKAYHIMDIVPHATVCLAVGRTAHNLHMLLKQSNIRTEKLHVVDVLSRMIESPFEVDNTTYVYPSSVGMVMERVKEVLTQFPVSERFIIIDAVHDLGLHVGEEKMIQMIREIHTQLKSVQAKIVFLYEKEKVSEGVEEHLNRLCDKVIEMN